METEGQKKLESQKMNLTERRKNIHHHHPHHQNKPKTKSEFKYQ